jgi:hypothetical protein
MAWHTTPLEKRALRRGKRGLQSLDLYTGAASWAAAVPASRRLLSHQLPAAWRMPLAPECGCLKISIIHALLLGPFADSMLVAPSSRPLACASARCELQQRAAGTWRTCGFMSGSGIA